MGSSDGTHAAGFSKDTRARITLSGDTAQWSRDVAEPATDFSTFASADACTRDCVVSCGQFA
jgi:hypothetical protein